jgi:hypothetical protein
MFFVFIDSKTYRDRDAHNMLSYMISSRIAQQTGLIDGTTEPRPQRSAKGADARRQTLMELARSADDALDTATVLRDSSIAVHPC